jgi:hypothetical protein
LRPNPRSKPRIPLSRSRSLATSSLRPLSRARSSCDSSDFTCTALYQPVLTTCAIARASFRPVLTGGALVVARSCRVSSSTTGRLALACRRVHRYLCHAAGKRASVVKGSWRGWAGACLGGEATSAASCCIQGWREG